MSATLTAPIAAPVTTPEDQVLVLHRVGWEQYLMIAEALPERRGLRMVYFDRRLTLLSPSHLHDWRAEHLGLLVVAVANGCGILWEAAGTTTYRRADVEVGVEGDKVYYFGANAERMKGPLEIDLSTQPPPDLVIEVEVSHSANDSVKVWGRLGVPEVWRLDARREAISFWLRRDDGTYHPIDRSISLPALTPADVSAQLRLAEDLGSARWSMQLAEWVRDVIAPRMGGREGVAR